MTDLIPLAAPVMPSDEERTYTEWLLDKLLEKGVTAEMSHDGLWWRVAWKQQIPNSVGMTGNLRSTLPSVINKKLMVLNGALLHPTDYMDESHVDMIADKLMQMLP